MALYRPVTVLTGASSGIGAALARVFADHGHEVALVARREPELTALADQIAAANRKRPLVLSIDLARSDAPARISHELIARGLEPAIVVNNAGFGLSGAATALDRSEQLAMIDLNVRTLTDMSLRWVESLARHRGGILNVASLAGFLSGPNMAVYYATKAYVLSFSEALHVELKPRGVRVTVLAPGPVPTEFQARAGLGANLPRLLKCTPEQIARAGYAGLMRGRRLVVPGIGNKLVTLLPRMLPRGLMLRIIQADQAGRAKARQEDWPRRRPEGTG
ncbi:MAG TPA: SDR family oxidoreductase [Xanthobacteraceae bacterium]|jgi:short-subunit dehydrogenase|nr:SDR family oxidoreductase [Xanthobacteraceae bacterium]